MKSSAELEEVAARRHRSGVSHEAKHSAASSRRKESERRIDACRLCVHQAGCNGTRQAGPDTLCLQQEGALIASDSLQQISCWGAREAGFAECCPISRPGSFLEDKLD